MTTSIKIYLDDERKTPDGFHRTYTVSETITLLEQCRDSGTIVEELSLDNDLGSGEQEGRSVADWLEEKVFTENFPIPLTMTCHSANPEAKKYMMMAFNNILRRSLL